MVRSADWTHVETPVSNSLRAVTATSAGAFAVGESGIVVRRQAGAWTQVLDGGPTGNGTDLRTIATTANGARVWFAGSSGVLACYDVADDTARDFSGPESKGDTWQALHVEGARGHEHVYAADDNGEVVRLVIDDTSVTDTTVVKPLSAGDAIPGFDYGPDDQFYAANANGKLLTASDIHDWSGTEVTDTELVDLETTFNDVYVVAGSGFGFRYGVTATGQSRSRFDPDVSTLHTVESDETRVALAGTNGAVVDREQGEWTVQDTPASTDLYSLALDSPDVAVGAGGVILERETSRSHVQRSSSQ